MVLTCPYCRESIPEAEAFRCSACGTPHHHDCFAENGGCTVFGCERAPTDDPKISLGQVELSRLAASQAAPVPSYLISRNGEQFGPYPRPDVRRYLAEGQLLPTDLAWTEGMPDWVTVSQLALAPEPPTIPVRAVVPARVAVPVVAAPPKPMFLYIPTARLIVLSMVTAGIFERYWIYRNWRFLKERDHLQIRPFWRALFAIFFVGGLLHAIKNDRKTNQIRHAEFNAGSLAIGWVLLAIASYVLNRSGNVKVNGIGMLIALPSVFFLLPAQKYINAVNEALTPRPDSIGWTVGQLVCLVIGIICWLVLLVGLTAS